MHFLKVEIKLFWFFLICVMESDHGNRTHEEILFRGPVRIIQQTPAIKEFCS